MLLPAVAGQTELIEAVRITSWTMSPFPRSVPGEEIGLWAGEDIEQILDLIREAPAGIRMRCFTPGYGIRAHGADLPDWPLFEIAFCFACNGALLLGPDIPEDLRGIQLFDPDSTPGKELLRRFRVCEQE
ncbi:hypothetical protein OG607_34625 [Streptomyces sp. NBC_01537]|uniref:hypothetical protein n=1 Tax=Streptomyces sp. NBC_01537 TaxID=2903896 RepID=UPI0038637570